MPAASLRQSLAAARHVVVKLGTQLLAQSPDAARRSGAVPGLDLAFVEQFAKQIMTLRNRGVRVTLVSSGAIGAGVAELGLARRPRDVAQQQAVAAVGQRRLMTHYHEALSAHGVQVAQLLLTRADFDSHAGFLNMRNCLACLADWGCVPIINENDTVATDELRFGDNDMLAALIANALRADLLVILSVVDGLLDGEGKRIEQVNDIDDAAKLARPDKSDMGTGGMASKLQAVGLVTGAGEPAIIANGREPDVLVRLLAGEQLGTVFVPSPRKLASHKRWIGMTKRPTGTLTVDAGAALALLKRGKSLLASGITQVAGRFDRGDVLRVRDTAGKEIARGLTNYNSEELALIAGKQSSQFEALLHRPAYTEVIHRDHLVLR